MNKRAARLQPLQHLAGSREDAAVKRLVDQQRIVAERGARLRELETYLSEYEKAVPGAGGSTLLANRHAFVARLREAVNFQARSVEQARAACDVERGRWLARHRDVAVLDQLAATYEARERRDHEHQVQKHMDEFALRRFLDGRGGG
jgi:flagellar FliJ protein